MGFVQSRLAKYRSAAAEEKLCYLLMGSIFLPFVFTAAIILIILGVLLVKKEHRDRILHADGIKWFGLFAIPLIFAPILQLHWLGLAAGVGFGVVLLVSIWVTTVMKRELFERCLELAVLLSLPIALVGFLQKGISYLIPLGRLEHYRIFSVFFNPNYYGAMIEMLVLICLYKLFQKPGKQLCLFYFGALAVNLTALYFADSFSAWAAIGVSVPLLLLLHKQYKILLGFVGVGVVALAAVLLIPEILPRLSFVDSTVSMRMYIWRRSSEGFLENPILGMGTLAYWMFSRDEVRVLYIQPHAHNILLDLFLNYGIVGAVGLTGFFAKQFGRGFIQQLRAKDRSIGLFAIALLVAVLVHGITDVTLLWHQTGLFFMFLLAGLRVELNTAKPVAVPVHLTVRSKQGLDGLEDAVRIRRAVFMKEQGFVDEFDAIDPLAYHVVVYDSGKPIATGRVFFDQAGGSYKIGRVAVIPEYRGHHIGSIVVHELEQQIRLLGGDSAMLSSQLQARGFYQKLGYQIRGEKYYDEHCLHVEMVKSL